MTHEEVVWYFVGVSSACAVLSLVSVVRTWLYVCRLKRDT